MGVSEGVIFQRFGTKKNLIQAALDTSEIDLVAAVRRTARLSDPARSFEDVAAALFAAMRHIAPASLPVLATDHPAGLGSPDGMLHRCRAALAAYLLDEESAGRIAPGAAATAAFMLAATLHHAVLFESVAGPTPLVSEQAVRKVARLLWQGLDTGRSHRPDRDQRS